MSSNGNARPSKTSASDIGVIQQAQAPDSGSESEAFVYHLAQQEQPVSSEDLNAILRVYCQPTSRVELKSLDFKKSFDNGTRVWGELLKDIAAMSNSGGGIIVFGVEDNGKKVGLAASLLSTLDPARVSDKVRRYSPTARIDTSVQETSYRRRTFAFLRVRPADRVVVFDSNCSASVEGSKQQRQIFGPGIVYVRRPGGNIEATQNELNEIIDHIAQRRVSQFLARIEAVAPLPPDAELITRLPGRLDTAYVLVGNGNAVPVDITDQPESAAVAISEVINPQVPFSSLDTEVAAQIRHWRQVDSMHHINPATLDRWFLERDQLRMNDDIAEFGFLSAGYGRGFITWWAATMSKERLREVVEREIETARHPMVDAVPYVVAALLWNDREELLKPLTEGEKGGVRAREAAKRVCKARDKDQYLRTARMNAKTVALGGTRKPLQELLNDRAEALEVFETLIEMDKQGECRGNRRQLAYQLDIALWREEGGKP